MVRRGSLNVAHQVRGTHGVTPIPRLLLLCPHVSPVWTRPLAVSLSALLHSLLTLPALTMQTCPFLKAQRPLLTLEPFSPGPLASRAVNSPSLIAWNTNGSAGSANDPTSNRAHLFPGLRDLGLVT